MHFGAGAVGRGFLGQLYSDAGWETVFVDVARPIIDALNARRSYTLHLATTPERTIEVRNVRGLDALQVDEVAREIAGARLISTAVRPSALQSICGTIAGGLEQRCRQNREPIDILICENLPDAAKHVRGLLRQHIDPVCTEYLETKVGLVETVISRMVPVATPEQQASDPLYIAAEEYAILPVDRDGFVRSIPDIPGLRAVSPFEGHKKRKLFTHNCGHSLFAYYGYQSGYTYVWQAVQDSHVYDEVTAALDESGRALIARYGFDPAEHQAHTEDLLQRFANRALGDTVARVAREPLRKLGHDERLVGAARLALECGVHPMHLARGIACALRYDAPDDEQAKKLAALLRNRGASHILETVCQLAPEDPLHQMVLESYQAGWPAPAVSECSAKLSRRRKGER